MPSRQNEDPASEATPEQRAANSLPSAIVLGCVGGLLDAFLYLDHGRVFAGAMTGNAVLFGISLLSRDGANIVHHAMPIVAFVCGVFLAEGLQVWLKHHAVTVALAVETVGLLIASFLPGSFPDHGYVFLIALLAAFQVASFRKTDEYSYASTYITGDLRTFVLGLGKAYKAETRREGLRQARDLGLIISGFLAGAVVSAILSPRLGNHTLWLACAGLVVVFAMALRRSVTGEAKRMAEQQAA